MASLQPLQSSSPLLSHPLVAFHRVNADTPLTDPREDLLKKTIFEVNGEELLLLHNVHYPITGWGTYELDFTLNATTADGRIIGIIPHVIRTEFGVVKAEERMLLDFMNSWGRNDMYIIMPTVQNEKYLARIKHHSLQEFAHAIWFTEDNAASYAKCIKTNWERFEKDRGVRIDEAALSKLLRKVETGNKQQWSRTVGRICS